MYIRTKDGVYEVEGRKFYDALKRKHYITTKGLAIKEDDIIKQSDTIEELCDEYVGVDNTCENGHQFLRAIPYKCANFWNGGVYGAVWCEFGLKYVAKLNSKGELELI